MAFGFLCILLIFFSFQTVIGNNQFNSLSPTSILHLSANNFSQFTREHITFVKFYANWCEHSKKFLPVWELYAERQKENNVDVKVAKVDCNKEPLLCSEHDIYGYPTLKLFIRGAGARYLGSRVVENLEKFYDEKIAENNGIIKSEELLANRQTLVDLKSATFENAIGHGSYFIKFFAPWCVHCRELLPVWQQLASEFVDNLHLTIAKVDCTVEQFICKKYRITQFPTLIWFQNGVEKDRYTDSRDINRLRDYVQIMLNSQLPTSTEETTTLSPSEDDEDEKETIIMKDVKDESTENVEDNEDKVHILNAQTFTQGVSFEGYAFVNYFAPWCSHCIKLAPVWSQLAKKFSKHPEIRISKVDCTANELLCRDHGIRAFPTLLFYRFGELIVEYNSFKDLDSLYDFVVKQVESNNDEHFLNEDNDDIGN